MGSCYDLKMISKKRKPFFRGMEFLYYSKSFSIPGTGHTTYHHMLKNTSELVFLTLSSSNRATAI